jgi:UDP-glucose 4-epimerase
MRILVTGGAGFIGSHVTEAFLADGHEVAVLDNLSTGKPRNIHPDARFFEADIRDPKAVRAVFEEFLPEVIDHHAAQIDVRKSLEDPVYDAETNVLGTLKLILEGVRVGTKRFIYASTGGAVYGDPATLPASELHPVHPECAYAVSKHTPEHYLELYRMLSDIIYVVLRYANVFGPRQNPHGEAGVNAIFIGMMARGKVPTIYGNGEQVRDYVYVGDVARANVLALTKGDGDIFNIGTGVPTSVNQIYEALQKIFSFDAPAHYAAARAGEIDKIYLDAAKAGRVLGWKPQMGFYEGLKTTVDWYRSAEMTLA